MKISVIGCGLRTPLLIHGLTRAALGISNIVLYDTSSSQVQLMASIGRNIASGTGIRVEIAPELAVAIEGSAFVISSIRVGG